MVAEIPRTGASEIAGRIARGGVLWRSVAEEENYLQAHHHFVPMVAAYDWKDYDEPVLF